MLEAIASITVSNLDFSKVALAIGSLGTAAYGGVEGSKDVSEGVSNRGFGDIRRVFLKLFPASATGHGSESALAPDVRG